MNPGGEAADQLMKMYLSGTEMVVRLSGSFLKNLDLCGENGSAGLT